MAFKMILKIRDRDSKKSRGAEKGREQIRKDKTLHFGTGNCPNQYNKNDYTAKYLGAAVRHILIRV